MGCLINKIKIGQQVNWWIRSQGDPQWNDEGISVLREGNGPPQELVTRLDNMSIELGEKPDDLEWGYSKCLSSR